MAGWLHRAGLPGWQLQDARLSTAKVLQGTLVRRTELQLACRQLGVDIAALNVRPPFKPSTLQTFKLFHPVKPSTLSNAGTILIPSASSSILMP